MVKVILVDDHPIVRRGLRETLLSERDIAIVAEADRSEEVLSLLRTHTCDVMLLDISLPGRDGLELLKDVAAAFPRVRVLVVSTHSEAQYGIRAVRAGAAGYLTKSSAPEELVRAVRSVVQTGRYISETIAAALVEHVQDDRPELAHEGLSDREHTVLRMLVSGKPVTEIAGNLSLSVKTVSTYRQRLMEKLGASTLSDVVRYALEHKLFD